jgi:hypothetical protein
MASLAGVWLVACASPPPPPKAAPPEIAPRPPERPPVVEGEIGGLPEEAMGRALDALGKDVVGCVTKRAGELEVLGGHLKLKLRVARDGSTRWAYLSESTLGDRDTERCVVELATARSWPKPVGGEGLAEKAFDVDPPKPPATIEEKRVKRALDDARREAARCKKGARGTFLATAYLKPNGRVVAAGVAVPSDGHEGTADCIVEAVKKLEFGKVGGKVSKLTFEI